MKLRPRHIGLLLVLATALTWRGLFWLEIAGTPAARWHAWDQSDMHTYLEQAGRLAAGDWLAHDPYYPYHAWMTAAHSDVWRSWYAPGAFYQAPLYSYVLAGLLKAGADLAGWMRLAQALLGTAFCGLVFGLAWRAFGSVTMATVAGLCCAAYGPLIMIESQLLREGAALFLTAAALWLVSGRLVKCTAGDGCATTLVVNVWRVARGRTFGIGLLLGVLALLHEAAAVVAAAVLMAGVWRIIVIHRTAEGCAALDCASSVRPLAHTRATAFPRLPPAASWTILLILGAIAGFAPLLVRNLAVGAPPLAQSTRSAVTWALANHPAAPAGGVTWSGPGPEFVAFMNCARDRGENFALAVLHEYWAESGLRGLGRFFIRWLARTLALAAGGEAADNTSYAWFRLHAPPLAFSLDIRLLAPLAAAGLALMLIRCYQVNQWLQPSPAVGILLPYALLMILALSAVFPLGRYRLFLLPVLAPLVGYGLVELWRAGRQLADESTKGAARRTLALGLGALFAVAVLQLALGRIAPFADLGRPRPTDFIIAARLHMQAGQPAAAAAELELGLTRVDNININRQMKIELALARGLEAELRGDRAAAIAHYTQADSLAPGGHPAARAALVRLTLP